MLIGAGTLKHLFTFSRNHHLFFTAVGCLSSDMSNIFKGFLSLRNHHVVVTYRLWQIRIYVRVSPFKRRGKKKKLTVFQLTLTCHLNAWWSLLVKINAMIIVVLWNYAVPLWCSNVIWNSRRWSCWSQLLCSVQTNYYIFSGIYCMGFSWCSFSLLWTQPHNRCFRPRRTKSLESVII